MIRKGLVSLVAVSMLQMSATALAQEPEDLHPSTTSYGGQIVLADISGLVLTAFTAPHSSFSVGELILGFAPYLIASPLVHGVHGNSGRAAASLILHLGAPVVGVLVGVGLDLATCGPGEELCGVGGMLVGLAGGMVAATIIDASVLAKDVPVAPSVRSGLTPTFSVARTGGLNVGLTGRF